jgi:hypothetical protein
MPKDEFYFYATPAQPEDQGGFCDTNSKIHYCNESAEEAMNNAAVHAEHTGSGSDIRGEGEADRYNTTVLEVDNVGSMCPARYSPGR